MKKLSALLASLVAILSLVACGGGDADADGNGAPESERVRFEREHPGSAEFGSPPLEFEADPGGDLAYTDDEVTAKEGNVTLEFTNPQSTPHNLTVEEKGSGKVKTETVSKGFAAVTITLDKAGDFVFYCSVPGHRKAGMEGKIVVDDRAL